MNKVRCAIYTRKSSEEGLEQDFNSLHAQREACSAYILSQASEGWSLLPSDYDDGGISGGTMERPALQRLLADIAAGQIDIVVVYKVDRLTRSLLDFARLVEAFDKAGTSFVSVTQSFNTTTSMGRLTLNMLLSFAQFEREVTAERIRDKIAASKAKGMWMGGTPPLGYKPDGRSLAVVEEQAALVRDIYRRYLELGTVRRLAEQLAAAGIRSPARLRTNGQLYGGAVFSRGQLYKILGNPVYLGKIAHKDKLYQGQHPAIVDTDTWDQVQRVLTSHTRDHARIRMPTRSLLAGKLVDAHGGRLIAAHATKGKLRYRYYTSRQDTDDHERGIRVPAPEIEKLVVARVAALFDDPLALIELAGLAIDPSQLGAIDQRCRELRVTLTGSRRVDIADLVAEVRIGAQQVEIDVETGKLADMIGASCSAEAPATLTLTQSARLTRTGRVVRLVDDRGASLSATGSDEALPRMVARARAWWAELCRGDITIGALAQRERVSPSWMTRVVRLAFLSPEVVEAIMGGRLRAGVDGAVLLVLSSVDGPCAARVNWADDLIWQGAVICPAYWCGA